MVSERFRAACAEHAARLAVVDGGERISYRELATRVTALGRSLRTGFSVKQGDIVAASLPNRWQFIAGFFAAADLGGVFMPFNPHWRAAELRWFAERFRPAVVLTDASSRREWTAVGELVPESRLLDVDGLEARLEPAADSTGNRRFEDEPALYLLTSGSTGRPKVVPRTHRMLVTGARNVAPAIGIRAGQRFLCVVPFHHANGFANSMLAPLFCGATLVLARRFFPALVWELVRRERIGALIASPFVYSLLAEHADAAGTLAGLEIAVSSGAPMSGALRRLCRERLGISVRQLYGSSETGTISIEPAGMPPAEGLVGRPIDGVEVRILDGEVIVRSPTTMSGYAGEPELNAHLFRDGFFRTGDLGRIDEAGNLWIGGRLKRILNAGGIKVDPVEIENVLSMLPAVRQCHVSGVADERETEIIRCQLALRPGRRLDRADIIAHCRQHLAEYKIPRIIEFVDEIPTDLAGKTPMSWGREEDELSRSPAEETAAHKRDSPPGVGSAPGA